MRYDATTAYLAIILIAFSTPIFDADKNLALFALSFMPPWGHKENHWTHLISSWVASSADKSHLANLRGATADPA